MDQPPPAPSTPPAPMQPYGQPPPPPVQIARIRYTGNFWPWFGMNLVWLLLTIVTVGLFSFYMAYWNAKYFVDHLELILPSVSA